MTFKTVTVSYKATGSWDILGAVNDKPIVTHIYRKLIKYIHFYKRPYTEKENRPPSPEAEFSEGWIYLMKCVLWLQKYHPEENKFHKAQVLFEKICDKPERDALGKQLEGNQKPYNNDICSEKLCVHVYTCS